MKKATFVEVIAPPSYWTSRHPQRRLVLSMNNRSRSGVSGQTRKQTRRSLLSSLLHASLPLFTNCPHHRFVLTPISQNRNRIQYSIFNIQCLTFNTSNPPILPPPHRLFSFLPNRHIGPPSLPYQPLHPSF